MIRTGNTLFIIELNKRYKDIDKNDIKRVDIMFPDEARKRAYVYIAAETTLVYFNETIYDSHKTLKEDTGYEALIVSDNTYITALSNAGFIVKEYNRKKVYKSFYVYEETDIALRKLAKEKDLSYSKLVNKILTDYIKK